MKTHLLPALALASLALVVPARANDVVRLETRIYVFDNREIPEVHVFGAARRGREQSVTFSSPAIATFGADKLSLDGATLAWSGGEPPKQFTPVTHPAVVLRLDSVATVRSGAPVQYIEKTGDGTLQVREIPATSSEAPHFQMTVRPLGPRKVGGLPRLACELDVSTVKTRGTVPGVAIPVGKPVLATFKEQTEFELHWAEWSGLLLEAPNGSNYTLLLLVRLEPENGPAVPTLPERKMSAAELDTFTVSYYQRPRPELIPAAIESLASSGFLDQREQVYLAFFTTVFSSRPNAGEEWRPVVARQDKRAQKLLVDALERARTAQVFDPPGKDWVPGGPVARIWGAFFASGDPDYIGMLLGQVPLPGIRTYLRGSSPGGMSLLARNARQHPVVRAALEKARARADDETRELIDLVLANSPRRIREFLQPDLKPTGFGYENSPSPWIGSQQTPPK